MLPARPLTSDKTDVPVAATGTGVSSVAGAAAAASVVEAMSLPGSLPAKATPRQTRSVPLKEKLVRVAIKLPNGEESTDPEYCFKSREADSFVWQYFRLDKEGEKAKCFLCPPDRGLFTHHGNTSNFKRHLEVSHKVKIDAMHDAAGLKKEGGLVARKRQQLQRKRATLIRDLIARLFAENMLPVAAVESTSLADLIHSALRTDFELPTRPELTQTLLPTVAERVRVRAVEALREVDTVSLAVSSWSVQGDVPLLVAHLVFVDRGFNVRTVLAGASLMRAHDDAETLMRSWLAVLGVLPEKVFQAVGDGSPLATSVLDGMRLEQTRCSAQSLHRALVEASEGAIADALGKMRNIIGFLRANAEARRLLLEQRKLLKEPARRLHLDDPSRWWSLSSAIPAFLQYEPLIRAVVAELAKSDKHAAAASGVDDLRADDLRLLRQVCDLTKRISDTLLWLETPAFNSYNLFAMSCANILAFLRERSDEPRSISVFKKRAADLLAAQFGKAERNTRDIMLAAAALDPRIRQSERLSELIEPRSGSLTVAIEEAVRKLALARARIQSAVAAELQQISLANVPLFAPASVLGSSSGAAGGSASSVSAPAGVLTGNVVSGPAAAAAAAATAASAAASVVSPPSGLVISEQKLDGESEDDEDAGETGSSKRPRSASASAADALEQSRTKRLRAERLVIGSVGATPEGGEGAHGSGRAAVSSVEPQEETVRAVLRELRSFLAEKPSDAFVISEYWMASSKVYPELAGLVRFALCTPCTPDQGLSQENRIEITLRAMRAHLEDDDPSQSIFCYANSWLLSRPS